MTYPRRHFGMVIKTYVQWQNMPNLNFKWIHLFSTIVSVSLISAFWWSENAISWYCSICLTKLYRIQFRCLEDTYRDVMCELCKVENFAMVIWLMVHRTHVPNQNFDGIVRYVKCSTKFIFGILKSRKHISGHCSIA